MVLMREIKDQPTLSMYLLYYNDEISIYYIIMHQLNEYIFGIDEDGYNC